MPLLGQHTAAETLDLIRAKDLTIFALDKARQEAGKAPDDTWEADRENFGARYEKARTIANGLIGASRVSLPLVGDEYRPVEPAYQGVLDSLSKTPGTIQKGDLQDLWNRVENARGSAIPIDVLKLQPTAGDPDLKVFQASDTVIRKGEEAAKKASPWLIVGGVAAGALALIALRR